MVGTTSTSDVNSEKLQALSQRNFGLDLEGGIKEASGIDLDSNGVCLALFDKEYNRCNEELTTLLGGRAAFLPGINGSAWTTPGIEAFDITGDIDLRIEILQSNATAGNRAMISHSNDPSNWTYEWRQALSGINQLVWSANGTATNTDDLGPYLPVGAMRVTMAVAGATITTYHSNNGKLDGQWIQVDQDTVAPTSIFNPAVSPVLSIGARANAALNSVFNGRIARAEVRNGINGTVVANPDFRFLAPGTTTFNDAAGNTWTRQGTAGVS